MAIGGSGNEGLISLQEVQEDGLGLVGKGHRQTGGSRSRDGNREDADSHVWPLCTPGGICIDLHPPDSCPL